MDEKTSIVSEIPKGGVSKGARLDTLITEPKTELASADSEKPAQDENHRALMEVFFAIPFFALIVVTIVSSLSLLLGTSVITGRVVALNEARGQQANFTADGNGIAIFVGGDLFNLGVIDQLGSLFSERPTANQTPDNKVSNDLARLATDIDASFSREKMRDISNPGQEYTFGGNGSFVRLGDSVAAGIVNEHYFFYATVFPKFLGAGDSIVEYRLAPKARARVAENAILLTLIKAEELGLNQLSFLQLNDADEIGKDAFFGAVEKAYPHLRSLRTINYVYLSQPKSVSSSEERQYSLTWFEKFQRLFGVRKAIKNQNDIFPIRAGETALIGVNAENLPQIASEKPEVIYTPVAVLDKRLDYSFFFFMWIAFYSSLGAYTAFNWKRLQANNVAKVSLSMRLGWVISLILLLTFTFAVQFSWNSLSWLNGLFVGGNRGVAAEFDWFSYPLGSVFGLPTILVILMATIFCILPWLLFKVPMTNEKPPNSDSRPDTTERTQLKATLVKDHAINNVETQDQLGFKHLVEALVQLIDNAETEPPLVLSLNGPWGSGKTSVMRMVETELAKTQRFHFAWFNAWQYRNETEILQAFLKQMSTQLQRELGLVFYFRMLLIRWRRTSDIQRALLFGIFALTGLAVFLGVENSQQNEANDFHNVISKIFGVIGVVGAGSLLTLLRWLKPFQAPLLNLFQPGKSAASITSVDEFNKEFSVFREALADKKFMVFIDDLDRCSPEAVVEVLKAVNLIANSTDDKGKTFFALGFDWNYILTSIEMHFADFIETSAIVPKSFSRDYLKKIVTLPVGIPTPDSDQISQMITELNGGHETNETYGSEAETVAKQSVFAKYAKHIVAFFREHSISTLVLASFIGLSVSLYQNSNNPEKKPTKTERKFSIQLTGETQEDGGAIVIDRLILTPQTEKGVTESDGKPVPETEQTKLGTEKEVTAERVVEIPSPEVRATSPSLDILNIVLFATLGMIISLVLILVYRIATVTAPQTPEPVDTEEFINTVNTLSGSIPQNPRDVVRLLNVMRLAYLLQQSNPNTGLKAGESIRASLWYYKNGNLIDPGRIKRLVLEVAKSKITNIKNRENLSDDEKNWANNIQKSIQSINGLPAILNNQKKLEAVLAIFENLLHSSNKLVATNEVKEPSTRI
ncbi:MAG: hypothetical protein GY761_06860 [Hyphomicrobiales bacterium]|nr:hypothetical protein [Hyphomicrobiales bacterium]